MNDPLAPTPADAAAAEVTLDEEERRILGVLIEKSLTTPQSYPLSLNALVNGCNQRSNRDPIVEYEEERVSERLEGLRERGFVTVVYPATGRVEKYRQELTRELDLDGKEMGIIAELLLRGPQSVGELRTRASRMKAIADLGELQQLLEGLAHRPQPLVLRLTPEGVKRGVRYTHGFYPADEREAVVASEGSAASAPVRSGRSGGDPTCLAQLESEVAALRDRLAAVEARLGMPIASPLREDN